MPDEGYSHETEQGVAGFSGALLQNGYGVFGQGDWQGDHEEEEEQREHGGFKGTGPITEDEHGEPHQNDQGCGNGQPIRVVQSGQWNFEAVPEYGCQQKQRYSDQGTIARRREDAPSSQINEARADERYHEEVGGVFIMEREARQAA